MIIDKKQYHKMIIFDQKNKVIAFCATKSVSFLGSCPSFAPGKQKNMLMKTTFLIFALALTGFKAKAQNENKWIIPVNDTIERTSLTETQKSATAHPSHLKPVYFNFRKRLLMDSYKSRISPVDFLNLCRTINDSAVQQQIARYDGYTKDKANLGIAALGSGAATFVLLGSAVSYAGQSNTNASASFAFFGVLTLVSLPVMAIYSSVPHQKRKGVLFRDLPIAYNRYVESLN
jgi:hypothetical protein